MDGTYSNGSFQVAHLSVKDYLTKRLEFSSEHIHNTAMLRCLQTFDPRSLVENHFVSRADTADDMRNYAIYLFNHAELSELKRPSSPLANIMKVFLFDGRLERTLVLQEWTDRVDDLILDRYQPRDPRDASFLESMKLNFDEYTQIFSNNGIYFIIYYNLLSVLELLECDCEFLRRIGSRDIDYEPLDAAVQASNYAVARWLLERSISDANKADKTHPTPYTLSSLCRAVKQGEIEMVDLLLKYGADPLARGHFGFCLTGWSWGCGMAKLNIFQSLLLTIERKSEEVPEYYSRLMFNWKTEALFLALSINWTEAIVILMEHDADVFSRMSRYGRFVEDINVSTLHEAIRYCDYSIIKMFLGVARQSTRHVGKDQKAKTAIAHFLAWVNSVDSKGRSALHRVKDRSFSISDDIGNESIMKTLVANGADPKIRSLDGSTAIHEAASIGSSTMIRSFQKTGVDIKARARNGATALHAAAGGKHAMPSVIHLLIEEGLDPLDSDHEGRTSLHYATASCNAIILKTLLLEAFLPKIDPVVRLPIHEPPATLDFASRSNAADRRSFQVRAFLNRGDSKGNRLLHFVGLEIPRTVFGVRDQRVCQIENTIRLLLEHGADINIRNNAGQTPILHFIGSCYFRNTPPRAEDEILGSFLALGADCNMSDLSGLTPMHCAASKSDKTIELLFRAGADIEAKDHNMRTPLHLSSRSKIIEGTRLLLQYGANTRAKDLDSATPLHYAAKNESTFCYYSLILLLVNAKADVEAMDNTGSTPLHWAATNVWRGAMEALLYVGADPNIANSRGATPLHSATQIGGGLCENLSLLIKAKANVNAVDNSGSTPLHWAADSGNAIMVQDLLRAGADPDIIDNHGASAMQVSVREAAIIHEEELIQVEERDEVDYGEYEVNPFRFLRAWFFLYRASIDRASEHKLHPPSSRLKRSQSTMLRTDQSWGDFSHVRAEEIARLTGVKYI